MANPDIRSLDIAMLRTFEALMAERSVSRAAARLFLSQPAVSASLKRLREVFGDALFTRSGHGVEPTARALALAPHVQAVLTECARLFNAGQEFDPAASDRIFRIAGSDHMSQLVLPRLCSELAGEGSGIRLLWEALDFAEVPQRLQRGDADIGFLPRPSPPASLRSELLYTDAFVLVTRRGNPRLRGTPTLADCCAVPFVSLGHGRSQLEDVVDQILLRAGHRRYLQVAVTSFAQIVDVLLQTEHAAIAPERAVRRYADVLAVHALPFELPPYGMYLCWRHRADDDPGIQWLRGRLRAAAAAQAEGPAAAR